MKIEPCEPCEWAGIDTPAEHYVGWDQIPLCDMHFELDKQGRLGNWVNENVDFTSKNVVHSGKVKLKPAKGKPDNPLDVLESDAWAHLKRAEDGSIVAISIAQYIIEFLRGYNRNIDDLETSLIQVTRRQ